MRIQRAFVMLTVLALACGFFVHGLVGCASLPADSEAGRLRDKIDSFVALENKVADSIANDPASTPDQKKKAEKIREITAIVHAALTDPDFAVTQLTTRIKDPYVGALVVFILTDIQSYQKALAASQVETKTAAPVK